MNRVAASCTRGYGPLPDTVTTLSGPGRPGDLVVARVVTIGAYPRIENTVGREVRLRPGDEIIGVLGDRHSTTSIYGGIPDGELPVYPGAPVDLMAVGGVIGVAASSPSSLGTPTRLELVGLAADQDDPNTPLRMLPSTAATCPDTPIVFVGGTAAEVGKTTFAAALVHHLSARHGVPVGVTKLAGTGRLRDLLTLADAGAHCAADFVDAGLATTYGYATGTTVAVARHLIGRLTGEGARIIVAELGGDVWAAGIPGILHDPALTAAARCLVLVPSDTMASLGVATWVRETGITVPTVHGVPFRNVMAARERMRAGLGVLPFDPSDPADLERLCTDLIFPAEPAPIATEETQCIPQR